MVKIPEPTWLTLPETLAWLRERGIAEQEAKEALARAFRSDEIRTRGRSKEYMGHATQTNLDGVVWDRSRIHWEENRFEVHDVFNRWIEICDVDVNRAGLELWLRKAYQPEPKKIVGDAVANNSSRVGRRPKYDWDGFYVEIAVKADLDGLPETQAELEREMAKWCQDNWGTEPSVSTIRAKISAIYNHARKRGR